LTLAWVKLPQTAETEVGTVRTNQALPTGEKKTAFPSISLNRNWSVQLDIFLERKYRKSLDPVAVPI
jgi:hypothetical protein